MALGMQKILKEPEKLASISLLCLYGSFILMHKLSEKQCYEPQNIKSKLPSKIYYFRNTTIIQNCLSNPDDIA